MQGWALVNLSRFIVWQPDHFESTTAPLVVCAQETPITLPKARSQSFTGNTRTERAVELRRVKAEDPDYQGCHIVFFDAEDVQRSQTIETPWIEGRAALTVSDATDFAAKGGMIQLLMNDDNAFFKINPDALEAAGVELASGLLWLCRRAEGDV